MSMSGNGKRTQQKDEQEGLEIYTQNHTCIHAHMHAHTHARTNTYTHEHTHTHTHTHIKNNNTTPQSLLIQIKT